MALGSGGNGLDVLGLEADKFGGCWGQHYRVKVALGLMAGCLCKSLLYICL